MLLVTLTLVAFRGAFPGEPPLERADFTGQIQGEPPSGPHPVPGLKSNLSADERGELFEKVWDAVQRHPFLEETGVDWAAVKRTYLPRARQAEDDEALRAILDEVVAMVGDGHVSMLYPVGTYTYPPLETLPAGDKILVYRAEAEAAALGFEPGLEVLTVDGQPTAEVWQQRYRRRHASTDRNRRWAAGRTLLLGPDQSSVTVTARGNDGQVVSGTFKRTKSIPVQPNVDARTLDDGYLYISWEVFEPAALKEVQAFFDRLPAIDPPGVVIDLRTNKGGFPAPQLVNSLFDRSTTLGSRLEQSGQVTPIVTQPPARAYDGPVVLLTSPQCGSSCDLFAHYLESTGRASLVGEPPAGLGHGSARPVDLPYGYRLTAVSPWSHVNARNEKLEGNPAMVAHLVAPSRDDLIDGRDRGLEKAIEVLRAEAR